MGRSCFLTVLLIFAVLSLSLSQGFGRRIKIIRHYQTGDSSESFLEESSRIVRSAMETEMDYQDPGANTNPRSGTLFNSPPAPPKHY